MTKQAQAHISPEEKPTPELLLRRFKLMDDFAAEVKKKNIEAGLDPKYMGYYIMYDSNDTLEKKKYLNWLKKVTKRRMSYNLYRIFCTTSWLYVLILFHTIFNYLF